MSPPDNLAAKPTGKDETQSSTSRKNSATAAARPQEASIKCPRCDSPNTKFCYYNNYSLTQPRHFCKTCRRYWTKGGALRNVPIGGGCRKNKKMKSSSSSSSRDSKESDIGGLKFLQGISPAVDFQVNFPRLNSPNTSLLNHFSSSFADLAANSSSPCFNIDPSGSSSHLMGFNFPLSSAPLKTTTGFQDVGSSVNVHSSLASSIESLSSINQDLHWKLQQQRLAMLFVGENQKEIPSADHEPRIQKPQTILFQNLDISKPETCGKDGANGNLSTEWFFDNSFAPEPSVVPPNPNGSNINESSSNWNAIQPWSNFNQYSALP